MKAQKVKLCVVGSCVISPYVAFAQSGSWYVVASGGASPSTPTVLLDIYAQFDSNLHAFAAGYGGLSTSEPGLDSVATFMLTVPIPTAIPGLLVLGSHSLSASEWLLNPAQSNAAAWGGPANPDNPIKVATLAWTTTDFTPRTIQVETELTFLWVYPTLNAQTPSQVQISGVGSTNFEVIPAPASFALLAAVGMAALRRRRPFA